MKSSYLYLMLTTLALTFLLTFAPTPVTAEETTVKTIQSVDATASTVTILFSRPDKTATHTFSVSSSTAVTVNGSAGKLADIKPGMTVSSLSSADHKTLDSLALVDK